MPGYNEVIKAHAGRASGLYKDKWPDVVKAFGQNIGADGANAATSVADVKKYLEALSSVAGNVAAISARLAMQVKARELTLDDSF